MNKLNQALKALRIVAFALAAIYLATNGNEIHESYLYKNVGNVVVSITRADGHSGGTGFHVKAPSGKTYIMTNKHVCQLKDSKGIVYVKTETSDKAMPKRVIEQYKEHDLCLVEPIEGVKGIKVSSGLEARDSVYVLGHPGLRALTLSKGNYISDDIIQIASYNTKKEDCEGKFIDLSEDIFAAMFGVNSACIVSHQTNAVTAVIYPGSSGSPAVNFYGNLVGVIFAGSNANTDGHMVPLSFVEDFLEQY